MPGWQPPRANEIDKKLRDDFRGLLKDYGVVSQETDPILAVLFRSFATQIESVYQEAAENIPLAVLDELMAGLGVPGRRALPAQAVVHLSLPEDRVRLEEGTQLIGQLESRDKLIFALDTAIEVSSARISLVAIYQNGSLQLHQGTELPKELEDARPSFEPVQAGLGPNPAVFIAIDVPDGRHLSNHGIYFELVPKASDLLAHLQREVWCLLDDRGEIQLNGMLRPRPGNAGVSRLEWLAREQAPVAATNLLPAGFYGGRIFIFPQIPAQRGFLTTLPAPMDAPMKQIFQAADKDVFAQPRAWLRIALPREVTTIAEDIVRIVLHCTAASNVEVLNETINFAASGTSVPFNSGGERGRYLVEAVSIKGERGSEYLHEAEPTANEGTGRYRFRGERLEIEPARTTRGVVDSFANVRLLLSNGKLANGIDAGAITTFAKKGLPGDLEITNLTAPAGGTDGEALELSKRRFAEILLSRERVLTTADLEANVRTFEPKVQQVKCRSTLERMPDGLRRVHRVTVSLDRGSFTAPDEEGRILQYELEVHLQKRALLGLKVQVAIEWN